MSLAKMIKATKNRDQLLVTPAFELYLAKTNGAFKLSPEVAKWYYESLQETPRYRGMTFSASSAGYCPRQQVFRFTPLKPLTRASSETNAIFIHGHVTHLKWQAMLLDAGILKATETSVTSERYNLTGTIDGILTTGDGWELKSANSRNYKWVHANGPMEKHILQIHCYMAMTGILRWSLVYENKDTQEWKEFIIDWDHDVWDELEAQLKDMNAHVTNKTLPPILPDCEDKKGMQFKGCGYSHECLGIESWPQRGIQL